MRRGRMFIYLALILVLGVVVLFFVYQKFMQPAAPGAVVNQPTPTPVLTQDVVMVTQHITRGQVMTSDVVNLVPYQKDLVIEGMFATLEDVVGKRARLDLDPGFVLTQNMLTNTTMDVSAGGSDAALMIPRGMVSISIPVDRLSSVSYAPQRGDHVNVIVSMLVVDLDTEFQTILPNNTTGVLAPGPGILVGSTVGSADSSSVLQVDEKLRTMTNQSVPGSGPRGRVEEDPAFDSPFYTIPSEQQRPRLVSQTLIQDVIVLQTGNFPLQTETQVQTQPQTQTEAVSDQNQTDAGPTPTPSAPVEPPPPPDVITLIVTPQDAVTLNYLVYSGSKLTLALRGTGDDTRVQTEAVTLQFLLDQYRIPIPIKLPYGIEPRVNQLEATLPQDLVPTATPTP